MCLDESGIKRKLVGTGQLLEATGKTYLDRAASRVCRLVSSSSSPLQTENSPVSIPVGTRDRGSTVLTSRKLKSVVKQRKKKSLNTAKTSQQSNNKTKPGPKPRGRSLPPSKGPQQASLREARSLSLVQTDACSMTSQFVFKTFKILLAIHVIGE